ncbi:uncharacterized protein CYBJADRAFT_174700 [Cyberlindnera jadinii NRRL Y-1542]|uniref:Uncharacterized protein n=1 Tax=Cyberlindnera jadinii (strain ATCC 18201 / CBS 1600 / BCRC 20928 / JCM 3617 / NBRC 0987 / NRRL Y-1542) TaxID=983966 RepID=A0A1E4RXX9_CYBJN|nr:hypothetical protein CYBJADRAFT_174700 [Cyberlindnera jadinii NRRL Y-1542]ODV72051.1 hypothetical protein CYBJADRAFT_174700 [Cyberlindnera jadinii NRRL Y-1542]
MECFFVSHKAIPNDLKGFEGRDESFKGLNYCTRIGLPMRALKFDTFINGSYGPP